MLENKVTSVGGFHYSRYIESWRNVGGYIEKDEFFDEWLRSVGVTESEIRDIHELSYCAGAFELEQSARPFVKKQRKADEELLKELEKEP